MQQLDHDQDRREGQLHTERLLPNHSLGSLHPTMCSTGKLCLPGLHSGPGYQAAGVFLANSAISASASARLPEMGSMTGSVLTSQMSSLLGPVFHLTAFFR
jgi:hypothetical protein